MIKAAKFTFKTVITLVTLSLIAYFGWKYALPKLEQKDNRTDDSALFPVTKVFDGDTFEVEISGKREKVRMLGIDTPEKYDSDKLDRDSERTKKDKEIIRRLGNLSSDFTVRLIGGKKVKLAADTKGDQTDKYGRLLRYVYLEDGTFVNKKIIEDGYATSFRRFKVSKEKEFIEAEKNARENKRGLWGEIEGMKYMNTPE